jgi:hypothetical protein
MAAARNAMEREVSICQRIRRPVQRIRLLLITYIGDAFH